MTESVRTLLLDDDPSVLEVFAEYLGMMGHQVTLSATFAQALERLAGASFDLVITDLCLPDGDGMDVVRHVAAEHEDAIIIVITAHASVESSLTALKQGAEDYFSKPVGFPHFRLVVERALHRRRLRREKGRGGAARRGACGELLGHSPAMNEVYRHIDVLARTGDTVLLLGETGTGKELAARSIHQNSPRAAEPFIAVACGVFSPHLLESELFGHVRGAFSGADHDHEGLFMAARGGTILLDEIETASSSTQGALLRVLDRKEVRPVGSSAVSRTGARVMVTSNQDLGALIDAGRFRRDLFHRVTEAVLHMPALRDHREDIPELALHFLEEAARGERRRFAPDALALFAAHAWPGNVRQLRHAVTRAVRHSDREFIRLRDLPADLRVELSSTPGQKTLRESEKEQVLEAMAKARNNKSRAARLLGVSRGTLYSMLEKHAIALSVEGRSDTGSLDPKNSRDHAGASPGT